MGNEWHKKMYSEFFAEKTLATPALKKQAREQVEFILRKVKIKKGQKILDMPCGTGRHSVLFARRGFQVTGLDISRGCLKLAKEKFAHKNAKYQWGNIKDLKKHKNKYDLTLNLFTSFGYFQNDKENEAVMKQLTSTLKSGGHLVMSLVNRDALMKVFDPCRWWDERDRFILQASVFDPKTKYNNSQLVYIDKKTGKGDNCYHRVRMYSKDELVKMMKNYGMKNIRVFGDFQGSRFAKTKSFHPVYIAEKA